MRENIGPSQQFVSVIFDFEYDAADESDHEGGPLPGSRNIPGAGKSGKSGKKVIMRENEVLMLINKTNADWWQVGTKSEFLSDAVFIFSLELCCLKACLS